MEPMVVDKMSGDASVMCDRITRGGRRLFYRLLVIQQPERARACGSGPKSTSDRRPVDPPPVVELRIFEGPRWEDAKDITFTYNANFFLFATLENARVIAHARGQPPQSNTPPILTGMPVSGMAYLDRPQEAGYFLFPDLSVRHEGTYKLAFNLYEETKEDRDKHPDNGEPQGASFDWRMELKSAPFQVYSAKKFPGLTSSTALSRVMAEQGTRVRIRRDVRMRRREGKGGNGAGAGEQGDGPRRHRSQTPDPVKDYRDRSMSGSTDRAPLSAVDSQRRPSNADFRPPPPPPPPPGFQSAQVPPPQSHMGYSGTSPYGAPHPHYGPPSSSSGHASPVPQSPSYSQHSHSVYGPPQTPTPYLDRRPSVHPADPQQQRLYNASPQRDGFPADIRRMSVASNYAGRSSTPLSGSDHGKMAVDYRDSAPSPGPAVKLPGISALVTQDPMQAPPQQPQPQQAAVPIPPPPPPSRQPPILVAAQPGEQGTWNVEPVNSNGKRQHPESTTNWLYRPNQSAKNGQRPETRPQRTYAFPDYYIRHDGTQKYLNEYTSSADKPWVAYRTSK